MRCLGRFAAISALLCSLPLLPGGIRPAVPIPQASGHGSLVEVPVRVYRENRYVDSLGPGDFDLQVDGIPRKIESFARIRKSGRTEPRVFLLCFEMNDAPSGIEKAVDHFFENVPAEGDQVLVHTPKDRWKFSIGPGGRAERRKTAAELKPLFLASLRRGRGMEPRQIESLRRLAASGEDEFMTRWRARDVIDRMVGERAIDETRYLSFIDYFKAFPGRKQILVFFREETVPIPPLFEEDWRLTVSARRKAFGRERIQAFFADAGLTFHVVFLEGGSRDPVEIIPRDDESALKGDFYQPYRDLALTTGGITARASDPVAAVKCAAAAVENKYILYFRPAAPPDGSFKEITVLIRKSGFTVFHRAGFFGY